MPMCRFKKIKTLSVTPVDTFANIDQITQVGGMNYRSTGASSFPASYKPSHFTDLDNSCYKLKDCPADQISAKEKCQNVDNKTPKKCGNAPDKCLFKVACKTKRQ